MSSSKEKALASIESQIQSLLKQKARLESELGFDTKIVFSQLTKGQWIIEKSSGKYFQWISSSNFISNLARYGDWMTTQNWTIIENFRLAKPEEVTQHINFLLAKSKVFVSIPEKSIPKPPEFFMVTLKQGIGSKKYHETYEIAEGEALRLAKQEKKKAYIMGVVATIDVAVEEVLTTKIEKWTNKM